MARDPVPERIIGRYAVFGQIASGGMATVHMGRLIGPAGFARVVAIKRLHPQFARDPEFVSMFLDEARLAGRIRHPNVVSSLDVVALEGELFLVMDYVEGESVARLRRAAAERHTTLPVPVATAVLVNALHGLHAAHEARSETGSPLGLIHRDVSPQNILVGVDGVARVVDFGVAKASGRVQMTREGIVKGKIAYMAPEQLRRGAIDRRADVYAASVVLWELLSGRRLFTGDNDFQVAEQIIREGMIEPPSAHNSSVPPELDQVVLRGALRDPAGRHATALEMADALEQALPIASPRVVGRSVETFAAHELERRAEQIARMEGASASSPSMAGYSAELSANSEPSIAEPAPRPERSLDEQTAAPLANTAPTQHTIPVDSAAAALAATRALPHRFSPAQPAVSTKPAAVVHGVSVASADAGSASAVSKVSWSATSPRQTRRTGLLLALASVAVLLLVALVVSIGVFVSSSRPDPELAISAGPPDETPSRPPARVVSAETPDAELATPAPPPAPSAVTEPSSKPAPAQPKALPAPRRTASKPAPDPCDPPFYYEAGRKRYKPGCLGD